MDVGASVLLGHELALRRQVDVIANNLANAQTSGFKREATVFHTQLARMEAAAHPSQQHVHQMLDFGSVHDRSDGPFQPTGNALDLAIFGEGWFGVRDADGGVAYTRAGAVRVAPDGFLEAAGGRLLGEGGQPIQVPPDQARRLQVAPDGSLSGPGGPLGRIVVFEADAASVTPRGGTLVDLTDARELPADRTRLRSGGLEGSNVQPVMESANLIEALRTYQSSQRMTESLSDLRRNSIGRLGRFGN